MNDSNTPIPVDAVPLIDTAGAALLAAIVQSSDDAIVSKTLDGQIRSWNASAVRIFGYSATEAIGKQITLIIPDELRDEEREILSKVRRGERVEHFDTIRITKDGRRIPISLTVSPVRAADGTIVGASKVARDISERRRTEEILRQTDREKDEFLALLAHELRNPLAPIRFALELTRKSNLSADQRRLAQGIIERQVTHMSRLLDDLLDVSRISCGKLELTRQPTELNAVITAAVETARPLLSSKHHALTVEFSEPSIRLDADPIRLAQVFSNLLINAAKFTDPGGQVQIAAVRDGGSAVITVRDSGIGIAPEMMPRLFKLFSQAPGTGGATNGGLGVGLSLVRRLVTMHGGEVEARSGGVRQGSEFVVRLPVDPAASATPEDTRSTAGASPPGSLRVLVIDDNKDAADCSKVLLELAGHTVETAYTGTGGLKLGEVLRPDVVLLDIGLPDINGYQVAERLRKSVWGARVTLLAVTGFGQPQDRQRARASGFDGHVTKPLAPETLEAIVGSIASGMGLPPNVVAALWPA